MANTCEPAVEAFLKAVGTPKEKIMHVRQKNIGHLPYVETAARDVQQAINKFVDAASADIQYMQKEIR